MGSNLLKIPDFTDYKIIQFMVPMKNNKNNSKIQSTVAKTSHLFIYI